MPNTHDVVHQCSSGDKTRDEEDVKVVGSWEDYTGSETKNKAETLIQGAGNDLFGTRADIEGEETEELSLRGKKKSVYRQRQHLEHMKV